MDLLQKYYHRNIQRGVWNNQKDTQQKTNSTVDERYQNSDKNKKEYVEKILK